MTISFVYPMFNEIGNIERVIRCTHEVAQRTTDGFEIIVVDDASTDGCGELAERMRTEFPELRVLRHERNRKLGAALKTGFAAARMDYVLYMDSDLPVAFDEVERVLVEKPDTAGMIIGYRLGRAENVYREMQSRIYNALLRSVFGLRVRDVNFAFKLFRRELVFEPLRSDGSFIDAELLLEATRRQWSIHQVGLKYHVRQAGVSTIGGPGVVPKLLQEMIAYRRTRWRGERRVIFNADDFGLSDSVNAGVIAAHSAGLVRSTSIMPTGDAFTAAAEYSRAHPALDVGLHFTLCDGRPVSDPGKVPSLIDRDGRFLTGHAGFVRRWIRGGIARDEVATELRAQIETVRAAGLRISHVDSHQHLHALPGILEVVMRVAADNGVAAVRKPHERAMSISRPFRSGQRLALSSSWRLARGALRCAPLSTPDHFAGLMQAGRWDSASLRRRVRALRPGVTEICCHPSAPGLPGEKSAWASAPSEELKALTDPGLLRILQEERIGVTSFAEAFADAPNTNNRTSSSTR